MQGSSGSRNTLMCLDSNFQVNFPKDRAYIEVASNYGAPARFFGRGRVGLDSELKLQTP